MNGHLELMISVPTMAIGWGKVMAWLKKDLNHTFWKIVLNYCFSSIVLCPVWDLLPVTPLQVVSFGKQLEEIMLCKVRQFYL